jgi:hypothetical protein
MTYGRLALGIFSLLKILRDILEIRALTPVGHHVKCPLFSDFYKNWDVLTNVSKISHFQGL